MRVEYLPSVEERRVSLPPGTLVRGRLHPEHSDEEVADADEEEEDDVRHAAQEGLRPRGLLDVVVVVIGGGDGGLVISGTAGGRDFLSQLILTGHVIKNKASCKYRLRGSPSGTSEVVITQPSRCLFWRVGI